PNFCLKIFISVSLATTAIGIIQYLINEKIPGLDARQQFALFGGAAGRVFLGGLLQQNAAAAFLLFPALYVAIRFAINLRSWWFGIATLVFFMGILLTISRSGLIGLSVGVTFLITILATLIWNGGILK